MGDALRCEELPGCKARALLPIFARARARAHAHAFLGRAAGGGRSPVAIAAAAVGTEIRHQPLLELGSRQPSSASQCFLPSLPGILVCIRMCYTLHIHQSIVLYSAWHTQESFGGQAK